MIINDDLWSHMFSYDGHMIQMMFDPVQQVIIISDQQIIHCPYMVDPTAGPLGQPMVYEYTFLVDLGLLDPLRHLSFSSGHFWQ